MRRSRGPIIAGIVAAVVVVLVVVGLILPKASQVRNKQEEVTQAEQTETQLRVQLQQLQEAAEEAGTTRRRLAALRAQVPPTADLPGLIRLLNTASAQSAVDFMSVSPAQPVPSADGTVSVISTQITVVGGFFAVDQFLFRLETLTRAAKVTQIQVSPGPQGPPQLSVSMTAEFYTTDSSAGPGSIPGPTQGAFGAPAPLASPTASPTGASPTPTGG